MRRFAYGVGGDGTVEFVKYGIEEWGENFCAVRCEVVFPVDFVVEFKNELADCLDLLLGKFLLLSSLLCLFRSLMQLFKLIFQPSMNLFFV